MRIASACGDPDGAARGGISVARQFLRPRSRSRAPSLSPRHGSPCRSPSPRARRARARARARCGVPPALAPRPERSAARRFRAPGGTRQLAPPGCSPTNQGRERNFQPGEPRCPARHHPTLPEFRAASSSQPAICPSKRRPGGGTSQPARARARSAGQGIRPARPRLRRSLPVLRARPIPPLTQPAPRHPRPTPPTRVPPIAARARVPRPSARASDEDGRSLHAEARMRIRTVQGFGLN